MKTIRTKTFKLGILTRGSENAKNLVLLIPGRLSTKDYTNFVSHADYLANRGFLAVAFDPPGTWDSPGSIDLYTTTNYLNAINELIEYFGNRPTLLVGHSRGATAAILASMVNSAVIGIVLMMPNLGAPTAPSEEDLQRQISKRSLDCQSLIGLMVGNIILPRHCKNAPNQNFWCMVPMICLLR